ncbi:hypothetical protein ACFXP3_18945 [Streptomyces sp. NPDC059096]|uniref:hypothetical protein n=1 Tax=Streptomyces sp. NPDC059096 TaxID=3346727 RepID=UPI0036A11FB4
MSTLRQAVSDTLDIDVKMDDLLVYILRNLTGKQFASVQHSLPHVCISVRIIDVDAVC